MHDCLTRSIHTSGRIGVGEKFAVHRYIDVYWKLTDRCLPYSLHIFRVCVEFFMPHAYAAHVSASFCRPANDKIVLFSNGNEQTKWMTRLVPFSCCVRLPYVCIVFYARSTPNTWFSNLRSRPSTARRTDSVNYAFYCSVPV